MLKPFGRILRSRIYGSVVTYLYSRLPTSVTYRGSCGLELRALIKHRLINTSSLFNWLQQKKTFSMFLLIIIEKNIYWIVLILSSLLARGNYEMFKGYWEARILVSGLWRSVSLSYRLLVRCIRVRWHISVTQMQKPVIFSNTYKACKPDTLG